MPVAGSQNDGNDGCLTRFMPFQGPSHLPVVAVVRRNETRTYKENDDVIAIDVLIDYLVDFFARNDAAIMLGLDDPLAFEHRELLLELVAAGETKG